MFPDTKNCKLKVCVHEIISRWRESHRLLDRFSRLPLRYADKAGIPKKPFNQHSENRAASKILNEND